MGGLQVEIVIGAIEVGRHGGDERGAILTIVGLAHGDAGDLGDGIGAVGRLQRSGKEVLLLDRLGGKLGVDAGAAEEEELPDAVFPRLVDYVGLDHQVVVDELRRVAVVCDDPSHPCGGKEDILRPLLSEEPRHRPLVPQVELAARPEDEVGKPILLKPPHNRRTDQAAMTCHIDAR